MRILLLEDDHLLAQSLCKSLSHESFVVDPVQHGRDALLVLNQGDHDMLILDLGLPDIDGIDVLKSIRKKRLDLPIIILTARDRLEQKIQGLDEGADDYLAKPFEISELLARIRVIERRLGTASSYEIKINNVVLDSKAHRVTVAGSNIDVSKKEYMVLKTLMENAGRIQSREQLENRLYDWGAEVASNAIEVHVHNLRKKLPSQFIKTVRGIGYSINLNDIKS